RTSPSALIFSVENRPGHLKIFSPSLFFLKQFSVLCTMSLFITSLNSGSNGNCYYIGNDREAVLVDAGISCREIERRMDNLRLQMKLVKALFISHEHTDHISGASVLSRKYKIPVYITPATLRHAGIHIPKDLQNTFTS